MKVSFPIQIIASLVLMVSLSSCGSNLQSTAESARTPQQVFNAFQTVLKASEQPQFNQSISYTNEVVDAYNTLSDKVNRMDPEQTQMLQILCSNHPSFMSSFKYFEKNQVPRIMNTEDDLSKYGTWTTPKPLNNTPFAIKMLFNGL